MSDTTKLSVVELRRERAKVNDELQAIAASETITEEQSARFDVLEGEFKKLTSRIEMAEKAERMAALTAKPVDVPAPRQTGGAQSMEVDDKALSFAQPKGDDKPGYRVARMVQAIGMYGQDYRSAAAFMEERYGDAEAAMALSAGSAKAGGVLIPAPMAAQVIELLRPASVVRASGAVPLPMPNGTLTLPKITGGATSEYIGTDDDMPTSEQEFGDLQLAAKKLATLVPVSNDLLQYSAYNTEAIILGDMVASMGTRQDKAFIRDNGVQNTPRGLRYWAPSGNVIAANATINLANVANDLGKLTLALQNANVRMINPGWLMAPRTREYLEELRDGNGNKAFPSVESANRLKSYPLRTTTQIPINLGAGTDESELYFVDFQDAIIGETQNLRIAVSTEAVYKVGANLVSAFSKDQTVIRVIEEHDFGMRHDEAVAVLTGVKWAP